MPFRGGSNVSKPYVHAQSSVKRFGGSVEDYLPIHERMDSTKSAHAEVTHRCVFHSAFGIYIIEEIFGRFITNSDGKEVYVRDIAEQHVLEDLGFIPSLSDWLKEMPPQPWMAGQRKMQVKIVD
ncbi:MAG: hypothetical protein J0I06_24680 [Planctomycetes bacterium]|nr:hypothetical protein [Planctomycetota bacterium]